MIKVDEEDPIGELEARFPYRDVQIRRGENIKEFYDLEGEIGRGKFGTVYRCREKTTKLALAAKFVEIARRQDRKNVEREVEIMRTLQHPRLIQLYDAFETDNTMVLVLELIEGGELFERVIDDDFILTEKSCTVFMRQICEGVAFIHSNNIIHLDLKPENILCLTRTGNRIKIIDFGLARKFEPDKKLQVLFGTPEFVAPEVVNFDQISCATDMWSVGVICYVLLSGLSPFMGENDIETMSNVTLGKYDFEDDAFDEISKDAKDFISCLLVQKKESRLTANDCLSHPWLKRKSSIPNLATSKENMKNFVDNYVPIKTQAKLRQNIQDKNGSPAIRILDESQKKFIDLENNKNNIQLNSNETIPFKKLENSTPEDPVLIHKHCSDLINIINSIEPLNSTEITSTTVAVPSMTQVETPNVALTSVDTFKGVEEQKEADKEDKTPKKDVVETTANDSVESRDVPVTTLVLEPSGAQEETKATSFGPSLITQGTVPSSGKIELDLKKAVEDLPNLSKSILSSFSEKTNITSSSSTSKSVIITSKTVQKSMETSENEKKVLTRMHSVGDNFLSNLNQNFFPKIQGVTLGKQLIEKSGGMQTQHEQHESNKCNKIEISETKKSEASTFKHHLKSTPPWFSEQLSHAQSEHSELRNRFDRRSSDVSCLLREGSTSGESSWVSDIKQFSAKLFESRLTKEQTVADDDDDSVIDTPLSWLIAKHQKTSGSGHRRPKNRVSYLNRDVPLGSPTQSTGFREYHLGRLQLHCDSQSAPQSPRYSPETHRSIFRRVLSSEKEEVQTFVQESSIRQKESHPRMPLIETNTQS